MPTFFSKDLKGGRKGRFMRELLKDEEMKKTFDKVDEQKAVVEAVKKFAKGKITNRTLAKAAGYLRYKGGVINRNEEKVFERKMIKAGPRYIVYHENNNSDSNASTKSFAATRPITARINETMAARKNMPIGTMNNQNNFNRPAPGLRLRPTKISGIGTGARGSTVKKF